jgi:hypothetical protein
MTHAAENLSVVILDLHPAATAIAPLPPAQFMIDAVDIYRQAGRQTFDDRQQGASM